MIDALVGAGLAVVAFAGWQGYNVLPVVFLAVLFLFLKQAIGAKGLPGKAVAIGNPSRPQPIRFDDIGGQATAKKELLEALDFTKDRKALARLGIRPLKGILLTGPPGTGKTMLAKAAATHTDAAFLSACGSDFVEIWAGVGAQRTRGLFRDARERARTERREHAIIFIDELDVLGGKRGQHSSHLEYDQTLNALLTEMDGINDTDPVRVLVIGATNRADLLDPALLRPGRFDRLVQVDLPDKEGRVAILKLHCRNKPLAPDVDLEALAGATFGFSGAHLESMANEAAIMALREKAEHITARHLHEALTKVIMGERLDRRPGEEERLRIAIHETGHALVSEATRPGSVATITIASRGRSLGHVRQSPPEDTYLATKADLARDIDVLLAGALAEELLTGQRSTGAEHDFQEAARHAKHIVTAGLSGLGVIDPASVPDEVMHETVRDILREREAVVRSLLEPRRDALKSISECLLDREHMDGGEFRRLMA